MGMTKADLVDQVAATVQLPKHQIDTAKIRALGMTFGGEALLHRTVQELIDAHGAS